MAGRRGQGEGLVRRRADGRWEARVELGLDEKGRRERKSVYGRTKREVLEKLATLQADLARGLPVADGRVTVEDFLERWLSDSVRVGVLPRTRESYALNVRRIVPHLGRVRLAALTPAAIQGLYAALLDRGLARRTVEQCHTVFHTALEQAVRWELIARNPCDAVTVPRPERREMATLTAEQVRTLFRSTEGDRLHALWVLIGLTGLRLGEATGIRWEDVDFGRSRLTLRRALQRQAGVGMVFVEGKTRRTRRQVHLAGRVLEALRAHREIQAAERELAGEDWQEMGLVFCGRQGQPLDPARVRDLFQRALREAGLPKRRPHDLRHTVATLLLEEGVHPKVVQEMLGHSTIAVTMDIYSHVLPSMHGDAVAKLDVLLGEKGGADGGQDGGQAAEGSAEAGEGGLPGEKEAARGEGPRAGS